MIYYLSWITSSQTLLPISKLRFDYCQHKMLVLLVVIQLKIIIAWNYDDNDQLCILVSNKFHKEANRECHMYVQRVECKYVNTKPYYFNNQALNLINFYSIHKTFHNITSPVIMNRFQ